MKPEGSGFVFLSLRCWASSIFSVPVSLFDSPSTRVKHSFFNLLFPLSSILISLPVMPPLPIMQINLPAVLCSWSLSHSEVMSWTVSWLAQLSLWPWEGLWSNSLPPTDGQRSHTLASWPKSTHTYSLILAHIQRWFVTDSMAMVELSYVINNGQPLLRFETRRSEHQTCN